MRVIVVDDEPMLQELVGCILEDLGCMVFRAGHGREALKILTRQPVDLVLTDIHMPVMSGLETIMRIREHGFTVPIIVMDSYPESFAEDEEAMHVQAVISKPFDLDIIRQTITEFASKQEV